jgi:hypothetical protein
MYCTYVSHYCVMILASRIVYMHTYTIHTYIHACIHTCNTYIHTYRSYIQIIHIIHTYIRTYIHIHAYIHTYMHACKEHKYIHIHTHTQKHMSTYKHTHAYIHTIQTYNPNTGIQSQPQHIVHTSIFLPDFDYGFPHLSAPKKESAKDDCWKE